MTRQPKQRAGVLRPRACWCTSCHCCHCPHWSSRCCTCGQEVLRSHFVRELLYREIFSLQWIQSYPCRTKTSQETQKSLQKFLEPTGKPEVIFTHKSLEFGKACEDLSWNNCTSTPHRSETNGIAERSSTQSKGRHLCCIVAIGSK